MRRLLALTAVLTLLGCFGAGGASAARNPVGSGQPGTASEGGAACGGTEPPATSEPAGFEQESFLNATKVYAGSEGTPSAENGSTHAVSEYDIACYQQTVNH